MHSILTRALLGAGAAALLSPAIASAAPIIYPAGGPDAAAVQSMVDAFRSDIGGGNVAGANGSFGGIRREINWDGVPDNFSAPNNLPANFFNVNSPRGVILSTPGSGFQVSADAANPTSTPVEFGNINPAYPTNFKPFSAERLFTALDSTITDVNFFVPGTNVPSFTSAFGVVFSDVDAAAVSKMEYFDPNGQLLLTFVPPVSGNESFSFVGVRFNAGEKVGRVRITSGNTPLGPNNTEGPTNGIDVVVMDDFIYAEPANVPEPATLGLLALGLPMLLRRRCR